MARFHDLTVTDIHRTIRDAVVVTLEPMNGAAEEFDFTAGQYLTFRRDFDGEELDAALGLGNVTHIGLAEGKLTRKFVDLSARLRRYREI